MSQFEREAYAEIMAHHESPKLSVIFGPRQVGKTHILKKLHKELSKNNSSSYFNLEFPEHSKLFSRSDEEIFNFLKSSGDYIFIDEFQYIENISRIFKAIYDFNDLHPKKKIKIYASGSSALEMHKHIKESMAGRYKKFMIRPLTLDELKSRKPKNIKNNKEINIKGKSNPDQNLIKNYLKFGGLPGVYNESEHPRDTDKQSHLKLILETYIQKDIKALIKEENISAFNHLIYILAEKQGQLISKANLAREVRLSESTIEHHLEILEQTFVLYKVNSFSGNLSNELKKSKKYYFYDVGVRNAILSDFKVSDKNKLKGSGWESYTYNHLLSLANEANTEILFWRTSDQVELDFIWLQNKTPVPIEVKSKLKNPEIFPAFKTFFKAYGEAAFGIVFNESLNEIISWNGREIHFISFDRILEVEGLFSDL
ncbi:MAG: ATP-binding protein [Candidatus Melainabacteria bacterium]|nr:ATP-binding protein [Candidatus Melainabacteria bacterium]